ncbi:MAG: tetratricopeptide repeat protein, partial [Endomicrobium sp.]|nr:tetratricopeptide repeat protein [Endomicrobium sp.]
MKKKNIFRIAPLFFCFFVLSISSCDIDTKLNNALEYYKAGEYEKAKSIYKSVLKKHPAELKALKGLGDIALIEKNYSESIENYKKAIEINPAIGSQEMVSILTYSDAAVRDEA